MVLIWRGGDQWAEPDCGRVLLFHCNPSRQGHLGAIVRIVVGGIPDGRENPVAMEWTILSVNPNALLVPENDFIARIAGQVQHGGGEVGMAVVREHHYPPQMPVEHAAFLWISREQDELLSV